MALPLLPIAAAVAIAAAMRRRPATPPPASSWTPGGGDRLTDAQIAQLLYAAGLRGADLETGIRIVLGESGGYVRARNVNTGARGKYRNSVDRGLWQLNNVAFPDISDADAYDPQRATAAVVRIVRRVGWRPWSAGGTKTHTLTRKGGAWVPDTDKIARARAAAARYA